MSIVGVWTKWALPQYFTVLCFLELGTFWSAVWKRFISTAQNTKKTTRPTMSTICFLHSLCRISSPMIGHCIFFSRRSFLEIAFNSVVKEPTWSHHLEQQLNGKSSFLYARHWRAVNSKQCAHGLALSQKRLRHWGMVSVNPPSHSCARGPSTLGNRPDWEKASYFGIGHPQMESRSVASRRRQT